MPENPEFSSRPNAEALSEGQEFRVEYLSLLEEKEALLNEISSLLLKGSQALEKGGLESNEEVRLLREQISLKGQEFETVYLSYKSKLEEGYRAGYIAESYYQKFKSDDSLALSIIEQLKAGNITLIVSSPLSSELEAELKEIYSGITINDSGQEIRSPNSLEQRNNQKVKTSVAAVKEAVRASNIPGADREIGEYLNFVQTEILAEMMNQNASSNAIETASTSILVNYRHAIINESPQVYFDSPNMRLLTQKIEELDGIINAEEAGGQNETTETEIEGEQRRDSITPSVEPFSDLIIDKALITDQNTLQDLGVTPENSVSAEELSGIVTIDKIGPTLSQLGVSQATLNELRECTQIPTSKNPLQTFMASLLTVKILDPAISYLEENYEGTTADNIAEFFGVEAKEEILAVVSVLSTYINSKLATPGQDLSEVIIYLDSKKNTISQTLGVDISPTISELNQLNAPGENGKNFFQNLDTILNRTGQEVLELRENTDYPINNISLLIQILQKKMREAIDSGDSMTMLKVKLLFDAVARIKDDHELATLAEDLKPILKSILGESYFISTLLTSENSEAFTEAASAFSQNGDAANFTLDLILSNPDRILTNSQLAEIERNPQTQKIIIFLKTLEDALRLNPTEHGEANLLISILLENVKHHLLSGDQESLTDELNSIINLVKSLDLSEDPLVNEIVSNPNLVAGIVDSIYQSEEPYGLEETVKVDQIKEIVNGLIRDERGPRKKLLLAKLIIDDIHSDEELKARLMSLEPLLKIIITDPSYLNMQLEDPTLEFLMAVGLGDLESVRQQRDYYTSEGDNYFESNNLIKPLSLSGIATQVKNEIKQKSVPEQEKLAANLAVDNYFDYLRTKYGGTSGFYQLEITEGRFSQNSITFKNLNTEIEILKELISDGSGVAERLGFSREALQLVVKKLESIKQQLSNQRRPVASGVLELLSLRDGA